MSEDDEFCRERKILDEVLAHWGYRGMGTTEAMIRGENSDCLFLVMDFQQVKDLQSRGVKKVNLLTCSDVLDARLRGSRKPLIVDHYVMHYLIRGSLRDAFEEGAKIRTKKKPREAKA